MITCSCKKSLSVFKFPASTVMLQGVPSAFSWLNTPTLLVFLQRSSAPALWSFFWPSSGLALTAPCPSYPGVPELKAVVHVGSQESRVQRENHLHPPAGHVSFDAAQDTVSFLDCKCALLVYVQFFISQQPQDLLLRATLNPFISQSVLMFGTTQAQYRALSSVELHVLYARTLLKPVQFPLEGTPSLYCINCATQFSVIHKLAERALNPTI